MRCWLQKLIFVLMPAIFGVVTAAKDYKGAELRTFSSYLYGRFEVNYKAAGGAGQTSTFFTYHELGSGGIGDWNELDIEMLGRYADDIQFNAITPGQVNHVHHQWLPFDPTADFHTYAIEWTPEYVAWFVDGGEVYRQTGAHVATLNKAQKIMMNIWPPAYSSWAGVLDARRLPFRADYDWVSYASYTPGAGNTGTANNFTLQWRDDFDNWNTNRWAKATHTWDGNECDFIPENCVFQNGKMSLCLTDVEHTGLADNRPPFVVSARYLQDTVVVVFSEPITQESAEKTTNYRITGVTIQQAVQQADRRRIKLKVVGLDENLSYNLAVLSIKDLAIPPNTLVGQTISLQLPPRWNYPLKINVGGAAYDDWLPDQDWAENLAYGRCGGGQGTFPGQLISGTAEQLIFRSEQREIVNYKIRVPNGRYHVTLCFAENYFDASGQRVFDINIEGQYVVRNFDIYEQVGAHAACPLTAGEITINDGLLDIHFGNMIDQAILNGLIVERLSDVDEDQSTSLPRRFRLEQNFPNPFNSRTTVRFELAQPAQVNLTVWDVQGFRVATLLNEFRPAGVHRTAWETTAPSGVYFCRLEAIQNQRTYRTVNKMLLMR